MLLLLKLNPLHDLLLPVLQDMLVVSPSGVGLYKPDPVGKPQVFYQGQVGDPLSFYTPGPKV